MPSWEGDYFVDFFGEFDVSFEGGKGNGVFAVFFSDFIKGLVARFLFEIFLTFHKDIKLTTRS